MSDINNLISGLNHLNNTEAPSSEPEPGDDGFEFNLSDEAFSEAMASLDMDDVGLESNLPAYDVEQDGSVNTAQSLSSQSVGLPSPKPFGLPLPKSASPVGLPSPKSASPVGLPSPKPGIAGGLPSPKSAAPVGLPSPKPGIVGGLPSPTSASPVGLPSPKSASPVGLPSPKPASPVGLPSPKSAAPVGLPSPKPGIAGGLPSSKPASPVGLPSPKPGIAGGLPSPKPGVSGGMPSQQPAIPVGLPVPPAADSMETPSPVEPEISFPDFSDSFQEQPQSEPVPLFKDDAVSDDVVDPHVELGQLEALLNETDDGKERHGTLALEAYGFDDKPPSYLNATAVPSNFKKDSDPNNITAVPSAQYATQVNKMNLEDSALGIVKGSDSLKAPFLKMDRNEPTGAFNHSHSHDFDNDSGLPIKDDPLGLIEDKPHSGADKHQDILGLFGDNLQLEPAVESFAAVRPASKPVVESDAITAIPIREPAAVPPAKVQAKPPVPEPPRVPSIPVPPAAKAKTGGNVVEVNAPKPSDEPENVSNPGLAEGELFDLNSIKTKQSAASRQEDKKQSESSQSDNGKKRKKKLFLVIALAVVVICIAGAALFSLIVHEKTVTDDELAAAPKEAVVTLNWDAVKLDMHHHYVDYYKSSIEKIRQNDLDASERLDIQGKVLVAVILGSTRFPEVFADDLEMLDESASSLSGNCDSGWCSLGLWAWGKFRDNEDLESKFESAAKGDSFKEIKTVLDVVLDYSSWKPEQQTFDEISIRGNSIIRKIKDDLLEWPLVYWIKASVYHRLGNNEDAIKVLDDAYVDETKSPRPGDSILKAEALLAADRAEDALKLVEEVMTNSQALPAEKMRAQELALFCQAGTQEWSSYSETLSKYLADNLADPDRFKDVVDVCHYINRMESCGEMFKQILSKDPNHQLSRIALIQSEIEKIGYDVILRPDTKLTSMSVRAASELIEDGLKSDPGSAELWRAKAIILYAEGNFDDSVKALDEVERGKEMIWMGSFMRDLIQFESGDKAKKDSILAGLKKNVGLVLSPDDAIALAIALQYCGDGDSALKVMKQAAQLNPVNSMILNEFFMLAINAKNMELANKIIKQLQARGAMRPEHEFEFAKLTEYTGDSNSALEKMLAIVKKTKDKPNPDFLAYIGELFMRQNQCDSAIPYFSQALELNPSDAQTHFFKGRCLYLRKNYEEALAEFNEAATQDDSNREYDLWIGRTLAGLNHISEAQRAFSAVIDGYLAKSEAERLEEEKLNIASAYYYRAELRKLQNNRSEAKKDFEQALKLMPEEVMFLSGYAIYLYENEMLKECISMVNKVDSLGSKMDASLYFVRGVSNLKLNKRSEALADLERARNDGFAEREESGIIGVREAAEVYERLGYLYRDLGRREEARNALNQFLRISKTLSPVARRDIQAEIDHI